jgi:hypothetical protein
MFARVKRCQKCGQAFECGGLFGCWCRSLKLDAMALASLREQYSDCLCPECLARAAQDVAGQQDVQKPSRA